MLYQQDDFRLPDRASSYQPAEENDVAAAAVSGIAPVAAIVVAMYPSMLTNQGHANRIVGWMDSLSPYSSFV